MLKGGGESVGGGMVFFEDVARLDCGMQSRRIWPAARRTPIPPPTSSTASPPFPTIPMLHLCREEQSKLLDQILGEDRNGERQPAKSYTDVRLCRLFLGGLCPHDLFGNTKGDLGPCPKKHDARMKQEYEGLLSQKVIPSLDREMHVALSTLVRTCDERIERANARLARVAEAVGVSTPGASGGESTQDPFAADIAEALAQVEALGEAGDVEGSTAALARLEELRRQQRDAQGAQTLDAREKRAGSQAPGMMPSGVGFTRACGVCNGILSEVDGEQRKREHFQGRLHVGYALMRRRLAELEAERSRWSGEPATPFTNADGTPMTHREAHTFGRGRGGGGRGRGGRGRRRGGFSSGYRGNRGGDGGSGGGGRGSMRYNRPPQRQRDSGWA
jgi:hypothetical protein